MEKILTHGGLNEKLITVIDSVDGSTLAGKYCKVDYLSSALIPAEAVDNDHGGSKG